MRYLSVCSGIEAATAAWHPLGWTPVAYAENGRAVYALDRQTDSRSGGHPMSERAPALKQAIANGINRVVEIHGDETFIACGYAAHDALITCISDELLAGEAPAEGVSPQPDQWATLRNDVKVLHKAAVGVEDNTPADDILRWLWRGKAIAYETVLAVMKRLGTAPVPPVEPTPPAARMRDSPRPPLTREALMTDTLTDTLTDTTAQRAALVAYYDLKRASYQREADQMDVKRASYQREADKMDEMGRTVRILSDANIDDEYHDLVVGSSTGIPHSNAR